MFLVVQIILHGMSQYQSKGEDSNSHAVSVWWRVLSGSLVFILSTRNFIRCGEWALNLHKVGMAFHLHKLELEWETWDTDNTTTRRKRSAISLDQVQKLWKLKSGVNCTSNMVHGMFSWLCSSVLLGKKQQQQQIHFWGKHRKHKIKFMYFGQNHRL